MNKKYLAVGAALFVLAASLIWFFYFKAPDIEYRFGKVKKSSITLKVLATGTVQPENRLQIKSSVAGRVESILIKEGQKVFKGQTLAWLSSTERAVLIDSARSQGPEEVKKWEEIYKPTPLIAPLNGTIILRSIEPGQTFTTGDTLLVMADRLTFSTQVDETDLAQIKIGQKTKVVLDAYREKEFDAKVSQIAYEAKTVNNVTTYLVEVLADEKIDFLRSGMTASVIFFGESHDDILVVPNEFIRYVASQPKVTVKINKKNEDREVKLGITDGKVTEILSGLNLDEQVALEIKKDTKAKSNIFSGGQPRGSGGGSGTSGGSRR